MKRVTFTIYSSIATIVIILSVTLMDCSRNKNTGMAWNGTAQKIPGKVQCEFYDLGGEGKAYHDSDSINNGSGKLNPANGSFLNEFRMNEGVDISYTKSNLIDNNPFNMVEPLMDQLYTGWTVTGEWINYTLDIRKTGTYRIGIMYTANGDGTISLDIDGKEFIPELLIPSTHNVGDTVQWRQWHHWNKIDDLITADLKKGIHRLTLRTVSNGNMNYDYLEFVPVE
jgi:hypothetical protein